MVKQLGARISNQFTLRTWEGEYVNKRACRLLSYREPLDNMKINFPEYTCQTDREPGLGPRGITWWAYALTWWGHCLCDKTLHKLVH